MNGAIVSPGIVVSRYAPIAPPTMPGSARRQTNDQSTLPKRQCEKPEMPVVKTSAAWMLALAVTGGMPKLSITVVPERP
jgi:hypothetical protein